MEERIMSERFMLDDCGELIDLNNHKFVDYGEECCNLLNELHDEKQSVIDWIDKKIEEIKPYNSELCRATLLELKEFLK